MSDLMPPLNIAQLNSRVQRLASQLELPIARVRVLLCTVVVSQMLPETAVIKGGMGLKIRFGEIGTRATADLDFSLKKRGEQFEQAFSAKLSTGWGTVPASKRMLRQVAESPNRVAFTGSLKPLKRHDPGLREPAYVIHPYRVSIAFLGTPWAALDVEVSDPEVGENSDSEWLIDPSLSDFVEQFGFGKASPVRVATLEYQIAQKIHAVTDLAYNRAHDLVDLQLLWLAEPNLMALRDQCVRTFRWRRSQNWPPTHLRDITDWELAYADARAETSVGGESPALRTVEEAWAWLQHVIVLIEQSSTQR